MTTNTDPRGGWTSASSAEYDLLCPGRFQAQRGLPDEDREWTESGRVIHALWTGTKPEREPTPEERDKADALAEQEEVVLQQWAHGAPTKRLVEHRLWHEFEPFAGKLVEHSGQFDVCHLRDLDDGREALVLDGKTGWLAVEAPPTNAQLRDLAILVAMRHGCSAVSVDVLKPFGKTPPPCRYEMVDLATALEEMEQRVAACHAPNPPRAAGEKQCRYCRAKATCPAFAEASLPVPLTDKPAPTNEQIAIAIKLLDGPRLGLFLGLVRLASDCAEQEVRARLNAGQPVDGWAIKPGRVTEKVTDPQAVWAKASQKGVTIEQFMGVVTVTKGGLKDALRAATGAKGKALEQHLSEVLEGATESKQSQPVLERV